MTIARKVKCPNCGHQLPSPTQKQAQAYLLVHIMKHTHKEAAAVMGITQQAVNKHLRKLKSIRPDLMPQDT